MSTLEPIVTVAELVDECEAAKILDTRPSALSAWRSTGRYALPFLKVGRKVRYRRSDLAAWLVSRTCASGGKAQGGQA